MIGGDTHPMPQDPLGRFRIPEISPHPIGTLGQDLEGMAPADRHDGEHAVQHRIGHESRARVRHGIDEDLARPAPVKRLLQDLVVDEDFQILSMPRLERQACPQAMVHAFGVAIPAAFAGMLAMPADPAGRDVARADRRPAGVRPFDLGLVAHDQAPFPIAAGAGIWCGSSWKAIRPFFVSPTARNPAF
jgi:hypothetical protein